MPHRFPRSLVMFAAALSLAANAGAAPAASPRPRKSAGLPVGRAGITIPPRPSAAPAGTATAERLEQGRRWLARAGEQAGGSAAWKAVRAIQTDEAQVVTMSGQSMKLTSRVSWRLPDRLLSVQELPFGEVRMGFDGTMGWSTFGIQHHEDPGIGNDIRAEYDRSLFHLFGSPDDLTVRAIDDTSAIDGVAYRVATVMTREAREFTVYFAPDSVLARVDYIGPGPAGEAPQTEIFADWKPVGALRYPHAREILIKGKPYLKARLTAVTLDPVLADTLFRKPGP